MDDKRPGEAPTQRSSGDPKLAAMFDAIGRLLVVMAAVAVIIGLVANGIVRNETPDVSGAASAMLLLGWLAPSAVLGAGAAYAFSFATNERRRIWAREQARGRARERHE